MGSTPGSGQLGFRQCPITQESVKQRVSPRGIFEAPNKAPRVYLAGEQVSKLDLASVALSDILIQSRNPRTET
jgi:hypothetical protein